jgi:biopolymer transport protein ExbD
MRSLKNTPGLNAGSMADIGFLLLIFFLVTTTIPNDKGIARKLPAPCQASDCDITKNERNVLRISLNKHGAMLVKNEIVAIDELKDIINVFIDNNGDGSCDYCKGSGSKELSDNPKEAVISISSHRFAPYADFIAVEDAISSVYFQLRARYIAEVFQKKPENLTDEEILKMREAYPLQISEAELK